VFLVGGRVRPAIVTATCLAVACAHGARNDVTPPLLEREQNEHLLSRATFGARPQDRERLARIGVAAFLDEQLHPERIEDGALEAQLAKFPVLERSTADLAQDMADERGMRRDLVTQLAQAKVMRAVASERQLQEVMADFWFNHFNVFAGKMNEAALLPAYEREIRERALGRFGDLLAATAHSPAMLVYLDNWRSSTPRPPRARATAARRRRGLNENYARELLELHTLGVDGGYTQADVIEVARCFTGWTVAEEKTDPRFVFRPGMHDPGVKRVLGQEIAAGGQGDGEAVLDLLAHHPSTARFVSRKLVKKFVSDDAPEALVQRAAETFLRTDGDIRSVLRTLFESPEFWSRRALRAKVRSPLELVAGSVRALGARVDDPAALARAVARMGEPLFAAQAPTGYPDDAAAWLSAGALLARIDFAVALSRGQVEGVAVDLDPVAARAVALSLGSPEAQRR